MKLQLGYQVEISAPIENVHITNPYDLPNIKVEKHLTPLALIPQNSRTHTNNLSTVTDELFERV